MRLGNTPITQNFDLQVFVHLTLPSFWTLCEKWRLYTLLSGTADPFGFQPWRQHSSIRSLCTIAHTHKTGTKKKPSTTLGLGSKQKIVVYFASSVLFSASSQRNTTHVRNSMPLKMNNTTRNFVARNKRTRTSSCTFGVQLKSAGRVILHIWRRKSTNPNSSFFFVFAIATIISVTPKTNLFSPVLNWNFLVFFSTKILLR